MAEDRENSSDLSDDLTEIVASSRGSADPASDHDKVIDRPMRRRWTATEDLVLGKFIETHKGRKSLYFTNKAGFFEKLGSVLAKTFPEEAERFSMRRLATKIGKMAAQVGAGSTKRLVELGPSSFGHKGSKKVGA